VEVGEDLHQLVSLAIVPKAADLAVDEAVRTLGIVIAGDQHGLVAGAANILARRRAHGGLEALPRPPALECVVRVLEERVAVAKDHAATTARAQLLAEAAGQLLAWIVGVG